MSAETMTKAQRRRAALLAKLALIRHWLLGNLAVPAVPGTVFNPRHFFADPARLPALLSYWAMRARRAGCGAGLPRRERESAINAAAQACLTYFLDTDYQRAGVTGDEFARAALWAFARCRRRFWRDLDAHREAERDRRALARGKRRAGDRDIFNRAQNSRTPDPRRIVHAADALGMDPNAVDGRGVCDEIPGGVVAVPGGPSGRGETDGRIGQVTIRDRAVNVAGGAFCRDRLALSIIDTRWAMIRGRGRARRLPACTVREGVPAPRPTFRPAPLPGPLPADDPRRPHVGDGVVTWRPLAAPAAVTVADAVHGMRRLGRSIPRGDRARQRIAANIRAARG